MELRYHRTTGPRGRPPLCERAICALLAALALAINPAQARAQAVSDTAIADARGVLLASGTLAKVADLDFGDIAKPNTAGTVTLTPAASAVCTTSFGLIHSGPCVAAMFAVRERKNGFVRIRNMSGSPIVLTGPGGATMNMTMTHSVADMVAAPGGGTPPGHLGRYQITSNSGLASFWIGGTLSVGATQRAGTYTGTFQIQVLFN